MSIKRYNGTSLTSITAAKRFDGNNWIPLSVAKRFDGEKWVNILSDNPSTDTTLRTRVTINLKSKTTYWGSGSQDGQYPDEIIQGSYASSSATSRHTLLFFDLPKLPIGSSIVNAELYTQRSKSSHGTAIAYASVKYAAKTSAPSTFKGIDLKSAANAVAFGLGVGKWIQLNEDIVKNISSSNTLCLALSAGSDYSLNKYLRCSKAATKLRLTYTKGG